MLSIAQDRTLGNGRGTGSSDGELNRDSAETLGTNTSLQKASKRVSRFSVLLSILLMICGFLAIMLPIQMSLGVVIVISWVLMISGAVQLVHLFRCTGIGHVLWKLAVAIIYFLTGLYLPDPSRMVRPLPGKISDLIRCCGASLLHCRSPLSLVLRARDNLGA